MNVLKRFHGICKMFDNVQQQAAIPVIPEKHVSQPAGIQFFCVKTTGEAYFYVFFVAVYPDNPAAVDLIVDFLQRDSLATPDIQYRPCFGGVPQYSTVPEVPVPLGYPASCVKFALPYSLHASPRVSILKYLIIVYGNDQNICSNVKFFMIRYSRLRST